MMDTKQLENFLKDQIPLARSMELKVVTASAGRVELHAPLEPNRNHLGTAFGGSLQSLLIFSCYTWLFSYLQSTGDCHVLIQEASTRYVLPVREDMLVTCSAPETDVLEKFLHIYKRKGKARIRLSAVVKIKDGDACFFEGEFVAEKTKSSALS